MAIKIPIKKANGITLNYHRISLINIDMNNQITILINSYVDEAGRQYEKDYANGLIDGEPTFPYSVGEYIHTEYSEGKTMLIGDITANVYKWLKSLADYKGAEDV